MIVKRYNISNFLFVLVAIDILIFPYFPLFAINTLFFLMFFDFCDKKGIILDKKIFIFSLFFFIFSLISTFFSYYGDNYNLGYFPENVKRFFQFFLFFIFYFYCYNFFMKNDARKQVSLIIDLFFISVFMWSLIYFYSVDAFLKLKTIFNNNDSFIDMYIGGDNAFYRFSYIWTDPNNIAYAILGVFLFTLFNLKVNIFKSLFYLIVVFFVCLNSMSTTAWLILFFLVLPCFLYGLDYKKPKVIFSLTLAIILLTISGWKFMSDILKSDIALQSFERFETNNIGTESGTSRLGIWSRIYSYYQYDIHNYIFLGQGYQLHYNDILIRPHNGLLLIFFAYGFFALIFFMYIFFKFKINKNYLFIIPFFLCFFINVMIGELKLFLLYILLLAFVRAKEYK